MLLVLFVDCVGDRDRVILDLVGLILSPFAYLVHFVLGLISELGDLVLGFFLELGMLFLGELDQLAVLVRSSCASRYGSVGGERNGECAHRCRDDCADEQFSTFTIHIYF